MLSIKLIYNNYNNYSINVGSYCGSLSSFKTSELGSIVIKESLIRAGLKGSDVSEVIMGQVFIILEEINEVQKSYICFQMQLDLYTCRIFLQIVIFQTLAATEGQNPARQAAIRAGIPIHVPAYQINMLCGSGLKYVHLIYA